MSNALEVTNILESDLVTTLYFVPSFGSSSYFDFLAKDLSCELLPKKISREISTYF